VANQKDYKTIEEFAGWLAEGLDRPTAKFLENMLRGIHTSKSIKLANVARALGESSDLHATCNRLSRNLAKSDLAETIATRLLEQGAHMVKRHTRLIVHVFELAKPNARKMQYLQDSVLNQTPGEANYQVCEIYASNTGAAKYLPLLTTFWSRCAPGYISDSQQILTALRRVLDATNGRGVVLVDSRGMQTTTFDDVCKYLLTDNDRQFISNSVLEDRAFVYRQQRKTLAELIEICALPYAGRLYKVLPVDWETIDKRSYLDHYISSTPKKWFDWAIPMEFGSLRARYQGRPVIIIVLKTSHSTLGESKTTIITSYERLHTRKTILVPIHAYISINDVIAAHKTLRDSYNPADLQVSKYDRMQLLITLLHAVIFFETRSFKIKSPLSRLKPHEGDYHRDFLLPEDVERLRHLDSN
jgi:hypothetical protein